MAEQTQHSRKIARVIETGLKYATYLFLLYVLTGIKKGGDLRLFLPYITALFLLAHLVVSRDFSVLRILGREPAAHIYVLRHQRHAIKDVADASNDVELDIPAVQALKEGFRFLNHREARAWIKART